MSETISQPGILKSEKYEYAFEAINSAEGEGKETAELIIKEIHMQAGKNLALWESEKEPGVKEVFSTIDVLDLINNIKGTKRLEANSDECEYTFVSSSTPTTHLFGIDGGTHTPIDITVGRVFLAINETINEYKRTGKVKSSKIVLLGSPLSMGGRITSEWAGKVAENGIYETQANLNTELVEDILKKNPKPNKILLTGHSFGTVASLKIASKLPPETQKIVQVLADGPAPTHGNSFLKLKGIQVLAGLTIDSLRSLGLKKILKDAGLKKRTIGEYEVQLKQNGIEAQEEPIQSEMKNSLSKKVFDQIVMGPLSFSNDNLYKEGNASIYVRQGVFDLATLNIDFLIKYVQSLIGNKTFNVVETKTDNGKEVAHVFPYIGGHVIDRYRERIAKRWLVTAQNLNSL